MHNKTIKSGLAQLNQMSTTEITTFCQNHRMTIAQFEGGKELMEIMIGRDKDERGKSK